MNRKTKRVLSSIVLFFFLFSLTAPVVEAASQNNGGSNAHYSSGQQNSQLQQTRQLIAAQQQKAAQQQAAKLRVSQQKQADQNAAAQRAAAQKAAADKVAAQKVAAEKVAAQNAAAQKVAAEKVAAQKVAAAKDVSFMFKTPKGSVNLNNPNSTYVMKRLVSLGLSDADVNSLVAARGKTPIQSTQELTARLKYMGYKGPLTGEAVPAPVSSVKTTITKVPTDPVANKAPAAAVSTKPAPRTPGEFFNVAKTAQSAPELYQKLRALGVEESLAKEVSKARIGLHRNFTSAKDLALNVDSMKSTRTGQIAVKEANGQAIRSNIDQWTKQYKMISESKPNSQLGYENQIKLLKQAKYQLGKELMAEAKLNGKSVNSVASAPEWKDVSNRLESIEKLQVVEARKVQLSTEMKALETQFSNSKKGNLPVRADGFSSKLTNLKNIYAEMSGRIFEDARLSGKNLTKAELQSDPRLKAVEQQIRKVNTQLTEVRVQKTTEMKANQEAAAQKVAAEKAAAQKVAADKAAAQKVAADKAAAQKIAAEKATAQKIAADKVAAQKVAADKVAAQKVAADKATAQKVAAEKVAAAKVAAPKAPSVTEMFETVKSSNSPSEAFSNLRKAGVEKSLAYEISKASRGGQFQSASDMASRVKELNNTPEAKVALEQLKAKSKEAALRVDRKFAESEVRQAKVEAAKAKAVEQASAPKAPVDSASSKTVKIGSPELKTVAAADSRVGMVRTEMRTVIEKIAADNPGKYRSSKEIIKAARTSNAKTGEFAQLRELSTEYLRAKSIKTQLSQAASKPAVKTEQVASSKNSQSSKPAAPTETAKVTEAAKVAETAKVTETVKTTQAPKTSTTSRFTMKPSGNVAGIDGQLNSVKSQRASLFDSIQKSNPNMSGKQIYEMSQSKQATGDFLKLNDYDNATRQLRSAKVNLTENVSKATETAPKVAETTKAKSTETAAKVTETVKAKTTEAAPKVTETAKVKASQTAAKITETAPKTDGSVNAKPSAPTKTASAKGSFTDAFNKQFGLDSSQAKSVDILKGSGKVTSASSGSKYLDAFNEMFTNPKKMVSGEGAKVVDLGTNTKASSTAAASGSKWSENFFKSWKTHDSGAAKSWDILKGSTIADGKAAAAKGGWWDVLKPAKASSPSAAGNTSVLPENVVKPLAFEGELTQKGSTTFNPVQDLKGVNTQISEIQAQRSSLFDSIKKSNPTLTGKDIYTQSQAKTSTGDFLKLSEFDGKITDLRATKANLTEMAKLTGETAVPKVAAEVKAPVSESWLSKLFKGKSTVTPKADVIAKAETTTQGNSSKLSGNNLTAHGKSSDAGGITGLGKAFDPKTGPKAAGSTTVEGSAKASATVVPNSAEIATIDGKISSLKGQSNVLAKELVNSGKFTNTLDVMKAAKEPGVTGELAKLSRINSEVSELGQQKAKLAGEGVVKADVKAGKDVSSAVKEARGEVPANIAEASAEVAKLRGNLLDSANKAVADGKYTNVKEALKSPEYRGKVAELDAMKKALKTDGSQTTAKASETAGANTSPALTVAEAQATQLRAKIQQLETGKSGFFSKFTKGRQIKSAQAELAKVENDIAKMKGNSEYLASKNKEIATKNPAQAKLISAIDVELAKPDLNPAYRAELIKRKANLEATPGQSFTKSALSIVAISAGTNLLFNVYNQIKTDGKVDWGKAAEFITTSEFWMSTGGVAIGSYLGAKVATMPFYYLITSRIASITPFGGIVLSLIPAFLGGALGGQLMGGGIENIDWLMMIGQTLGSVVGTAVAMMMFPGAGMIGQLAGAMIGGFLVQKLIEMIRGPQADAAERETGSGSDVEPLPSTTDKASSTFAFTEGDVDAAFAGMQSSYQQYIDAEKAGNYAEAATYYQNYSGYKARLDSMRQSSYNAAKAK
jgi:hypothetical protein